MAAIDAVIGKHAVISQLLDNGWPDQAGAYDSHQWPRAVLCTTHPLLGYL
jgi:hypothetical protein